MSQDDKVKFNPNKSTLVEAATNTLVDVCHGAAVKAGWWSDPATGEDLRLEPTKLLATTGWKLALVHSEISEATEGMRKDTQDEHLPSFKSGEVEFADAIIRICDLAGAHGYRLGEALAAKLAYNAVRADHKPGARAATGGKKY